MDTQININDKDKNMERAAEQWLNLVVMLIKLKRQQQKVAKIRIKNNYEYR